MRLIVLLLLLSYRLAGQAPESDCVAVHRLARIATSKSASMLKGHSAQREYRSELVAAHRMWRLRPDAASATGLLRHIPVNETEELELMTLGDLLCSGESEGETTVLAEVRDDLPRALSKAILIEPSFLPQYLKYAINAASDPHNDIAFQMVAVCQKNRIGLLRAIERMREQEKEELTKHVFNVQSCKPIAIPESAQ